MPPTIGAYTLIRKLGEGGMGVVYEAEQSNPRRRVAVKIVRGGLFVDDARIKMFEREAAALARLKHPGIGAIYEAGRTTDGQHFFAMELVGGRTLAEYLAAQPISPEETTRRLRLFRLLCDAVHYAHQRGVIHRDLKPSNILLSDADTSGTSGVSHVPKILDFGLARITDSDVRGATIQTEVGVLKGTLPYMSPEQTKGEADRIDLRTDVYALGVILYEMVAGRRPYELEQRSLVEALRIICEVPPRPLRRGSGGVDTDVQTIVMKALEKDPERRYGSAAELGTDIERYLTSQPILAHPPSAAYQLRKFAGRNRTLVAGVAATFLVLTAGVISTSMLGLREARQRRSAERAGYVANVTAAEAGLRLFDLAEVKRRLAACAPPLRGWEWRHLSFRSEMSQRILGGHTSRVYPVAMSPDGTLIASGSADPENTIRLWRTDTDEPLAVLVNGVTKPGAPAAVRGLAFSPDGRRLAAASDDRVIHVWDVEGRRKLLELTGHEARVNALGYTPDGGEIVSASWDKTVRRWNAETGAAIGIVTHHEGQIWGVALCGDGSRVASGSLDGDVRLTERVTGRVVWNRKLADGVLGVACTSAGDLVAAACFDGLVRVFDGRTGEPVGAAGQHDDYLTAVAFTPDGRTLASASKDRTVRLWDARTGEPRATLIGHDNAVMSVLFSPRGDKLLSGSWDRTVRVWSTDLIRASPVIADLPGGAVGFGLSEDGKRLIAGLREDGIRIFDTSSGSELGRIPAGPGPLLGLAVSSDGRFVAAEVQDPGLQVWEVGADFRVALLRERKFDSLGAITFLPGGSEALVGHSSPGSLARWNFRTGEIHGEIATPLARIWAITLTPDRSAAVVAGMRDLKVGLLLSIDLSTGKTLAEHEITHIDPRAQIGNPVTELAFSPDGARIVSAHGQDFTLRLWDARSLEPIAAMPGHTEIVRSVAFSSDGARIVSGANDYSVRLWDAATFEPLLALRSDKQAMVGLVRFTPSGDGIISGEGTIGAHPRTRIRIWRTGSAPATPAP